MQKRKPIAVLQGMLSKCLHLLNADSHVEGALVVGSMADDTADEFSDIDLYVVADDKHYAGVYGERIEFAKRVGDVLSTFEVDWPNCQMLGVIYRNYVEIDVCYTRLSQIEVFSDRFKILLNKSGRIHKALVQKEYSKDAKAELKRQIDFALYNVLHAVNMWRRGEYWAAVKQVETLRKRIIVLTDLSSNSDMADEQRRMESLLPPKFERQLRETLCRYDKDEILKSIISATELFCGVGVQLAGKLDVEFPYWKFSHLLRHLEN